MLIGIRSDLTLRTLTERYAEAGQIAIVATMRWDCVLARPKAFSVTTRLGGY